MIDYYYESSYIKIICSNFFGKNFKPKIICKIVGLCMHKFNVKYQFILQYNDRINNITNKFYYIININYQNLNFISIFILFKYIANI